MLIRRANLEDAASIAKVHVDSWRPTYRGIVPDSYLERLSYERREAVWKQILSNQTDEGVFVAEAGENGIVGFSSGGKFSIYFHRKVKSMKVGGNLQDAQIPAFGEGLLVVDGPIAYDMGLPFSTRMTIAKLTDGSLWICDPVQVSTNTLDQIKELGTVKYLVASTWRHIWRLKEAHRLFPDAELWSSRHVPRGCKGLPFTGFLPDEKPEGWDEDFEQLAFEGNPHLDEILFFHKKSRTLIIGDIIQNHTMKKGQPLRNTFWKIAGVAYGGVPRDMRLTFKNRNQARQSLDKLMSWDFDKVIIGHGPCVDKDAKAFVEQAFQWLK